MQPYVNANKKSVLLRFAPVGSSRLYSKWDTLPSLRSGWDDFTMPQLHPSTQHHATARTIECDAAIFCPHRVFCFQLRRSHRVNHRHGRAAMVHRLAHALDIAIPPQQLHGIHLSEAVRGHILRQPKRPRRPLHVPPHRLSRPVLPVIPPGKNPLSPTGFRTQLRNQPVRQIDPTPLPRLLLHNPELPPDLPRAQRQNVADPQARV